ncbi:beta-ketoacyl-ACP synthase III [Limosilactobacillus caecicola]|uniref:beta-ketoacyl-ACP synthase III n=1 Tax=Limosilactobacillus caecicola TaxID=2941332 RepID=UPI00203C5053|nr:beta-ketoacyl-ACP synthase III [Limosilactobacillus caecicola]
MQDLKIVGTAAYVPPLTVSNDDLTTLMDTSDEWITSRTGIRQRHISQGENTSELAVKVGQKLLAQTGYSADQIDLIIVATMSPDAYTPSTAAIVQGKLGAANAVAFDLSAACSGFVFALETAKNILKASAGTTALVIGAEVLSKLVDWHDRSTAVLFGDGAGGVLLTTEERATPLVAGSDLRTMGQLNDKIVAGATTSGTSFPKQVTGLTSFTMAGRDVYKFATNEVPKSIHRAAQKAGIEVEQIDYFLLHQANARIIKQIAKRLAQPLAKFPLNIDEYGNTAAASEPILLNDVVNAGKLKPGMTVAMSGFGGGLSVGTLILNF